MSKPNAYLAKQAAYRQALAQACRDTYSQFDADCALLVLHDHYGFGSERLDTFGALLNQYVTDFDPALDVTDPECGYTQECMDRKLADALGERFQHPFPERYEWLKQVKL